MKEMKEYLISCSGIFPAWTSSTGAGKRMKPAKAIKQNVKESALWKKMC
jgi:hypothetical protein